MRVFINYQAADLCLAPPPGSRSATAGAWAWAAARALAALSDHPVSKAIAAHDPTSSGVALRGVSNSLSLAALFF